MLERDPPKRIRICCVHFGFEHSRKNTITNFHLLLLERRIVFCTCFRIHTYIPTYTTSKREVQLHLRLEILRFFLFRPPIQKKKPPAPPLSLSFSTRIVLNNVCRPESAALRLYLGFCGQRQPRRRIGTGDIAQHQLYSQRGVGESKVIALLN